MRNKGKNLLVLLMSMLMVIGAFGVTSFAGVGSYDWKYYSKSDDDVYTFKTDATGKENSSITMTITGTGKKAYTGKKQEIKVTNAVYHHSENTDYTLSVDEISYTVGNELKDPIDAGVYDAKIKLTNTADTGADRSVTLNLSGAITITKKVVEPIIKSNLIYNGDDQDLVSTDIKGMTFSVAPGAPDTSFDNTIPQGNDAKTYTVYYKVPEDSNYTTNQKASSTRNIGLVEVTIDKKQLDAPSLTAIDSICDGESKELVEKITSDKGKALYSKDGGNTYSASVPTEKEAGEYTVTAYIKADADSNYKDSATSEPVTATIYEELTIGAEVTMDNLVYGDGVKNVPSVAYDETTVDTSAFTYTYNYRVYGPGNEWQENDLTADELKEALKTLDRGHYWLKINIGTGVSGLNVKDNKGKDRVGYVCDDFKVTKRPITVSVNPTTKVYDNNPGNPESFEYTISNLPEGVSKEEVIAGSVGRLEGENVGDYSFTGLELTDDAEKNYTISKAEGSENFTITKATENEVTISVEGWTYGDPANTPEATADYGNPTVHFRKAGENEWVTWNKQNVPTYAGTYEVRAIVAGTDNYVGGEARDTFVIAPKTVSLTWTDAKSLVYDGQSKAPTVATDVEGVTVNTVEYTKDGKEVAVDAVKDAGTYTATAKSLNNSNYALPTDGTAVHTFTITQRPVKLHWLDSDKDEEKYGDLEMLYTGDDAYPTAEVVDGVVDGDKVTVETYAKSEKQEDGSYKGADMTVELGDYHITATKLSNPNYKTVNDSNYKNDKGNYNRTVAYTIAKGEADLEVSVDNWIYGEDPSVIDWESENESEIDLDDVELGYITEEQYEAIVEEADGNYKKFIEALYEVELNKGMPTDAGSYYAIVRTPETTHYESDIARDAFTVRRRPVTITWSGNRHVYDGKAYAPTATVDPGEVGTGRGLIDGDECTVTVTGEQTDTNRLTDKRNYTARAASLSNPNYRFSRRADRSYNFRITRREVVVSFTDPASLVYDGTAKVPTAEVSNKQRDTDDVNVTVTVDPEEAINVGDYIATAVALTGEQADDYKLPKPAPTHEYSIAARPVVIQWANTVGLVYNGKDQKPGCYIENLVEGETEPALTIVTKDANDNVVVEAINAGDYTSTVTAVDSTNYTITGGENLTKQFSISPADVTVTADNKTVSYGDPVPKLTSKTSGVPAKGDEVKATLTTDYFQNAKAGAYTIKVTAGDNPNYNVKVVNGTLTVNDKVTTLVAQGKASGKKAVVVSWNGVTGAASYDVYLAKCNTKKKTYAPKYKGTTSGNSLKVKKLKKGTCYKYFVVAKAANGAAIAQSEVGHFIAGNVKGKKTNAKSITASTNVVSLNKGGSYVLTTSQAKAKGGKKYKLLNGGHASLTRYISSNPAVATVGYDNGVITAVGGGYCKVYAIAVNGMWSEVEVYVN
ncbi:MAG: hypothetical protein E7219_06725 [Clostridiales bacterium]|nr:hypothetical protein [Clostridiales bacterium]